MLVGWIAAVIGTIMVVFSLNSFIREIRKGGIPDMEDQSFSDTFYNLLNRTDRLTENLDDINQTFYETVERLEKRIELLEKKSPESTPPRKVRGEAPGGSGILRPPEPEGVPKIPQPSSKLPEEVHIATQIRKLLNDGKDTQQIARELNLGIGEVELIRRLKGGSPESGESGGKKPRSPG